MANTKIATEKMITLTIAMPVEMRDELDREAEQLLISRSALIRLKIELLKLKNRAQ